MAWLRYKMSGLCKFCEWNGGVFFEKPLKKICNLLSDLRKKYFWFSIQLTLSFSTRLLAWRSHQKKFLSKLFSGLNNFSQKLAYRNGMFLPTLKSKMSIWSGLFSDFCQFLPHQMTYRGNFSFYLSTKMIVLHLTRRG